MYDVIVVGARVAGAATGMLLARRGMQVLVVDRASFPSDTLSTHTIQVPGVARLARWGLLERVIATGAPPIRDVRFESGPTTLVGRFPAVDGVDSVLAPRRTVLDEILVEAARAAGAEVREGFTVDGLNFDDDRVTGVRGRSTNGASLVESARLVIGADGKHSVVARLARAAEGRTDAPRSIAYYTYWEGVPVDRGAMRSDGARTLGVWPTNDGLAVTYLGLPAALFRAFRADIEGSYVRSLEALGELGATVLSGHRVERFYGTADLPNRFRTSVGPGWALVGDAGLVMDPITGQGIGHAFRDAELVAEAIAAGLGGARPLEEALAAYQRERDRATLPMYEVTLDQASFGPRPEQQLLLESLAGRQAEIDRFLGVLTGAVEVNDFFSPWHLVQLVGLRGLARLMLAGRRPPRPAVSSAVDPGAAAVGRATRP
jgi:2-polyprenyl-6-methoxyphenol hydroxylase-like FAD-dependent oxidoreductase